jgi:hypothetical protein
MPNLHRLAWAVRVAADCADRQMIEQGRTEWDASDRALADQIVTLKMINSEVVALPPLPSRVKISAREPRRHIR